MSLSAQVREYVDSLVHPSARSEVLAAARHRAFIAPRVIGGLAALTVVPAYLAISGAPTRLEVFVYAWFIVPVLVAFFLSRTGRYGTAHVLSTFANAVFVSVVAKATGGITSFMAVWLVVVPLEAILYAPRRVGFTSGAIALAAAGFLALFGETQAASSPMLMVLGIASAAFYGMGVALGAAALARKSSHLLSAEEDRYRLLARNMTDVITRHGRNGIVRFASPAVEAVFGVPPRKLLGHGLFDRVHVGDRPAYLTALADAAAAHENRSVEFRIRREPADHDVRGHFIWVEMRCGPLDRPESTRSEDCELVAVIRDVTERKTQEQAVEAARADAERANAAKGRFLATMSHELRTPLNAIIGFSDLLSNEDLMQLDKQRRQDYAKLISDSGHHLLSVVNGILDMSKIETGNFEITPEPFTPAPVITACCDMMALRAREAGIDLVCRVSADLPDVVADKRAVKQVLINLLSNAIKFTDRGGQVVVSAEADASSMTLAIEDNGVGIAEGDLAHVGNPFFQVRGAYDRPHDGTGLGLSIVKGLVALHGGTLNIRSHVGNGTRVAIYLPIDCEKARVATKGHVIERLPLATPQLHDNRVRKRA